MRKAITIRGAAALGKVFLVDERRHAHGFRTKPYPVWKRYETTDGMLRIEWFKGDMGKSPSWVVYFARNETVKVGWDEKVTKTWADPHSFSSVKELAEWVTR